MQRIKLREFPRHLRQHVNTRPLSMFTKLAMKRDSECKGDWQARVQQTDVDHQSSAVQTGVRRTCQQWEKKKIPGMMTSSPQSPPAAAAAARADHSLGVRRDAYGRRQQQRPLHTIERRCQVMRRQSWFDALYGFKHVYMSGRGRNIGRNSKVETSPVKRLLDGIQHCWKVRVNTLTFDGSSCLRAV